MNDTVFEAVEKSSRILRLDFSSIEFAKLVEEQISPRHRFRQ